MASAGKKLTKRTIDAMVPAASRVVLWDMELRGFGLRVEPSGAKTFILRYRPKGSGASGTKQFVTIGRYGVLTPEEARTRAKEILGEVANGRDPAKARNEMKAAATIAELFEEFSRLHVKPKLKPSTLRSYRSLFTVYVDPQWGKRQIHALSTSDIGRWHAGMTDRPVPANRVLSMMGAMYTWGAKNGLLPRGINPCIDIDRYKEQGRERYLSARELERLGAAIREAETVGIPWNVDDSSDHSKHVPKDRTPVPIGRDVAAALRLLLLTGARLKEILHLQWEWIDLQSASLVLPVSKTGRRVIYLNGPALVILESLPRTGKFVFMGKPKIHESGATGQRTEAPRSDLKRPWEGIRRMAGLEDVRLHDLRHTHASVGVGSGVSLQIVSKLLGHNQLSTTQRYAHLASDPIRSASEELGSRLAEAMGDSG